MSDDKFHIVGEVKVGTLDDTMRTEWDRLYAQQMKLVKLQASHEEALDAFWDALQRQFGHHLEQQHDVTQSLRVGEDGDVFVEHCACPSCQAILYKLSVSETVEEMYKSALIPSESIDFARARAKHVDSQREMRKKMMN